MRLGFTLLLAGPLAQASTFSAIGGLGLGHNTGMNEVQEPPPVLGAETMFELSRRVELGGFLERSFLTYQGGESGAVSYLGAQARFHFFGQGEGPFADATFGVAKRTQGENSTRNLPALGGGVGYEIPLAHSLGISPHIGVRLLPDSVSSPHLSPVVAGAMMFSLHL